MVLLEVCIDVGGQRGEVCGASVVVVREVWDLAVEVCGGGAVGHVGGKEGGYVHFCFRTEGRGREERVVGCGLFCARSL